MITIPSTSPAVELLPCPFCGADVGKAFENLFDNEEDEIERCWTVNHGCPHLAAELWAQGATEAEAIANWNTRTPQPPKQSLPSVVVTEATFLCERLREFERDLLDDAVGSDFNGHVLPSLARLEMALQSAKEPLPHGVDALVNELRSEIDRAKHNQAVHGYGDNNLGEFVRENADRILAAIGTKSEPALGDVDLIGLLRREGLYSGVWFADRLLEAATHLEKMSAAIVVAAGCLRDGGFLDVAEEVEFAALSTTNTEPASGDAERELGQAKREALSLANALYRRWYRDKAPNWQPLDDAPGIISQIDNMTAGLGERIDALEATGVTNTEPTVGVSDLTDDQLAQAIGDPGSIVGMKGENENVPRWGVRAIRALLSTSAERSGS